MAIDLRAIVEPHIAARLREAGYPQGDSYEPYRPTLGELLAEFNKLKGVENPLNGAKITKARIIGEGFLWEDDSGAQTSKTLYDELRTSIMLANLGWNAGAEYPPEEPMLPQTHCSMCDEKLTPITMLVPRFKIFGWVFTKEEETGGLECLSCDY